MTSKILSSYPAQIFFLPFYWGKIEGGEWKVRVAKGKKGAKIQPEQGHKGKLLNKYNTLFP